MLVKNLLTIAIYTIAFFINLGLLVYGFNLKSFGIAIILGFFAAIINEIRVELMKLNSK